MDNFLDFNDPQNILRQIDEKVKLSGEIGVFFKSGLTIPSNQTFILGEFNNKNYSAELINQSELKVMVKVIEKESGVVIRSFGLAPKERTKIYISKTNTVYFENENKVDVKVDVILSKGVEGMRYVDNK